MQEQTAAFRHEKAEVVAIDNGHAWVIPLQLGGCGSCSAQSTCGTGILAKAIGNRRQQIRLVNNIRAMVGDVVLVSVPERGLLLASALTYLLPIVALFLSAVSLSSLGFSELSQVLGAVLGLLLGFVIAQAIAKQLRQKLLFTIQMVGLATKT